jgi:pimeloyl-ACP methyl ester carboxylesterase
MKEQIFIYNRKNQKIAVLVDHAENSQGLVFVMHALSGFKEQPDSVTFAKAFSDHNYTVIRFDTTNSFGESDGNYEDATVTNYYEDLEDVIARAHDQDFYQEPFVLCGASLGGLCIILYAEQYPNKVKALAPVSTLISGQLSRDNYSPEKLQERERTGRRIEKRSNGDIKQLKRSHMIDRLRYDILPKTHLLTMPVLLVV